jgi:hypothetical protein
MGDDYRARSDNGMRSNDHFISDGRSDSYPGTPLDHDLAPEAHTRAHMCPVVHQAFMVNAGAGIDDHALADSCPRIDDCAGGDDRTTTDRNIRGNRCPRVHRRGEAKAFSPHQVA